MITSYLSAIKSSSDNTCSTFPAKAQSRKVQESIQSPISILA
jgi:hypothetical protein